MNFPCHIDPGTFCALYTFFIVCSYSKQRFILFYTYDFTWLDLTLNLANSEKAIESGA